MNNFKWFKSNKQEIKWSKEIFKDDRLSVNEKFNLLLTHGSKDMKRFAGQIDIKHDRLDEILILTDHYNSNIHDLKECLKLFITAYLELTGKDFIYYGEFFHMVSLRTRYSKSFLHLGLLLLTKDYNVFVTYPDVDDINLIKFKPNALLNYVFSENVELYDVEPIDVYVLNAYKNNRSGYNYSNVFISDPEQTLNRVTVRETLDTAAEIR